MSVAVNGSAAGPCGPTSAGKAVCGDDFELLSDSDESLLDHDESRDRETFQKRQSRLIKVLNKIKVGEAPPLDPAPVPPSMAGANLLLHQLQAVAWMRKQEANVGGPDDLLLLDRLTGKETLETAVQTTVRGGVLADPVRCGKSRCVIALCEAERAKPASAVLCSRIASAATLIVCRAATIRQWANEITTCVSPAPRVLLYASREAKRMTMFAIAHEYDYVLVTYQMLRRELCVGSAPPGKIHMIHWMRAVADDAHTIQSMNTQRSRACMQLSADRRWAVTSAPFQRSIDDLFAYARFLRARTLGTWHWWEKVTESTEQGNLEKLLQSALSRVMLRRCRITCFPQIQMEVEQVDLYEDEQKRYLKTKQRVERVLTGALSRETKTMSVATEMFQLCQHACLSYYIAAEAERAHVVDDPVDRTVIMDTFSEQLQKYIKGDNKATFIDELLTDLRERKLEMRDCPICYEPLLDPTLLSCGHIFCKGCIITALAARSKCPVCVTNMPGRTEPLEVPARLVDPNPFESTLLEQFDKWPPSAKMDALLSRIKQIPADEKAVVFCNSARYLRYAAWRLRSSGVASELLTGSTKLREQTDILARFHGAAAADAGYFRTLLVQLTPKTASFDATVVSHCFLMACNWCPMVEQTAVNCVIRVGVDQKPLRIVKFLAKNTVEEQLDSVSQNKRSTGSYHFGLSSANWNVEKSDVLLVFPDLASSSPKNDPTGPRRFGYDNEEEHDDESDNDNEEEHDDESDNDNEDENDDGSDSDEDDDDSYDSEGNYVGRH